MTSNLCCCSLSKPRRLTNRYCLHYPGGPAKWMADRVCSPLHTSKCFEVHAYRRCILCGYGIKVYILRHIGFWILALFYCWSVYTHSRRLSLFYITQLILVCEGPSQTYQSFHTKSDSGTAKTYLRNSLSADEPEEGRTSSEQNSKGWLALLEQGPNVHHVHLT